MYTLLIADDEADERALIVFSFEELSGEFSYLEASNGRRRCLFAAGPCGYSLSDIQIAFFEWD